MAKAIRYYHVGPPDVLRWEAVDVGEPGPGEVRVRHEAVGLNFADTYFRSGLYPAELPAGMGVEAAGVIEAVGPGVAGFAAGDRVTYTGSPLGAYSTERVMPADSLIKLPEGIAFETAAAMTMRGLTAAYLLNRIYPVKRGRHRTAARRRGRSRADLLPVGAAARRQRHRHRLDRREGRGRARPRLRGNHRLHPGERAERVRELTGGAGVPVVYDSVGETTTAGPWTRSAAAGCWSASAPRRAGSRRSTPWTWSPRDRCSSPARRSPTTSRTPRSARRSPASSSATWRRAGSRSRSTSATRSRMPSQAHRDLESGRSVGSSVFCRLMTSIHREEDPHDSRPSPTSGLPCRSAG